VLRPIQPQVQRREDDDATGGSKPPVFTCWRSQDIEKCCKSAVFRDKLHWQTVVVEDKQENAPESKKWEVTLKHADILTLFPWLTVDEIEDAADEEKFAALCAKVVNTEFRARAHVVYWQDGVNYTVTLFPLPAAPLPAADH